MAPSSNRTAQAIPLILLPLASATLAYPSKLVTESPVKYLEVVPPRLVYSYSASVRSRTLTPASFAAQLQNASASFHVTSTTG